jgi:hypothetical protein
MYSSQSNNNKFKSQPRAISKFEAIEKSLEEASKISIPLYVTRKEVCSNEWRGFHKQGNALSKLNSL